MSLIVGLLAWVAVGGAAPQPACSAAAVQALTQAQQAVLVGETAVARGQLEAAQGQAPDCAMLATASRLLEGWDAAAAAAKAGGTAEALAPLRTQIAALEGTGREGATPATYGVALLHAAAAASQDEREELKVWLEHARLLSSRLTLAGDPPAWPLPIELAEATLWLMVDDYEQAEKAFAAANARQESVAALAGLARARDRRGNKAGACTAFRRVTAIVPAEHRSGALAAEARGYTLLCDP